MVSCRPLAVACIALLPLAAWAIEPPRATDDQVIVPPAAGPPAAAASRYDLAANFDGNIDHDVGIILCGVRDVRAGGLALQLQEGAIVQFGDGEGRLTLVGGPPPTTAPGLPHQPAAIAAIRGIAARRLAEVTLAGGLSAADSRRLELALESDLRRITSEIVAIRQAYQGVTVLLGDAASEQMLRRYRADLSRCRKVLRDPLGDGSLFSSVLAGIDRRANRAGPPPPF
jgi:hypothetical protein